MKIQKNVFEVMPSRARLRWCKSARVEAGDWLSWEEPKGMEQFKYENHNKDSCNRVVITR